MNFVVLAGKIISINKHKPISFIELEVERPFKTMVDQDLTYDIKILLNNDIFYKELQLLHANLKIIVKGRIEMINKNMQIIGERLTLI